MVYHSHKSHSATALVIPVIDRKTLLKNNIKILKRFDKSLPEPVIILMCASIALSMNFMPEMIIFNSFTDNTRKFYIFNPLPHNFEFQRP